MKKIAFFFSIAMLIIAACSQKKPAEKTILGLGTEYFLFPESLNGRVKEMRETSYWAVEKDGKLTKGNHITWKEFDSIQSTKNLAAYFDNTGALTRYEILDDDNSARNSRIGTFENGKCTRWDYKLRDSTTYYMTPLYNESGDFIGLTGYRPVVDTLVVTHKYKLDENGRVTEFEYFDYKSEKTGHHECLLSDDGKVLDIKYFDRNDSVQFTMMNIYNDQGFFVKQEVGTPNQDQKTVWLVKDFVLDDHGNWVQGSVDINHGLFKLITERSFVYY